jgi:hypothetical protein
MRTADAAVQLGHSKQGKLMFLHSKDGRSEYLIFLRNLPVLTLLGFIGAVFLHGGLQGDVAPMRVIIGCSLWAMALIGGWFSCEQFVKAFYNGGLKPARELALDAYPPVEGPRAARWKRTARRWWALKRVWAEVVVVAAIVILGLGAVECQVGYLALPALEGKFAK